jgi:mannose-1-phosphate guanylyltransferase
MAKGLVIRGHRLEESDAFWSDLGTPRRYAAAHQALLFGQVRTDRFGAADPFLGLVARAPRVWAHPTAGLERGQITGPAWLGAGCSVAEGAQLGAAVSVGPTARVGARARLNRVAVLDGAEVPEGQHLEDAIVAPGGLVVPTI